MEVSPLISYVSPFELSLLCLYMFTDFQKAGEGLEFLSQKTIKAPAVVEKE